MHEVFPVWQRILTHAQPERNLEKNKIEKKSKVQNRSIFEQSKKWPTNPC